MYDRVGFEEFYRAYHRRVRGLAARKFGEADADDIAQEAMLRAYRHYARLDTDRSPWPWLAVVTHNVGVNHVQAGRRTVPVEIGVIEELSAATDDMPADAAIAADVRRMLSRALRRLSERDRSALQLHELDGVAVADIATRFGTSPNVIRQRLFRARRHLADQVQALGGRPAAAPPWWLPSGDLVRRLTARVTDVVAPWSPNLREDVVRAALAGLMLLGGGPAATTAAGAVPPDRPATVTTAPSGPESAVDLVRSAAEDALEAARSALDGTAGDPLGRVGQLFPYDGQDQCLATRAMSQTCPLTRLAGGEPADQPDALRLAGTLPSEDGTLLRVDVLLPPSYRAGARYPVILAVGPDFGGELRYAELWRDGDVLDRGYAYVQVGLRGRGGSEGCADFGGRGEQRDVAAAVRWAAGQPWSSGRVAMWGLSYDGWAGVMALAEAPRELAAVVMTAPSTGLRSSLYTAGDVRYAGGLWPVTHSADAGRCAPPALELADPDAGAAFWRERDLLARAAASRVPVFWTHGFSDPVAPVGPAAELFRRLRGPKQGWLGQHAHVVPRDPAQARTWFSAAMGWLDAYAGRHGTVPPVGVVVQAGDGTWRAERRWPPADATATTVPLRAGRYADAAGNHGESPYCRNQYGAGCGIGTWTFSQALPYDVHLAGAPVLRAGPAPVVALVYDVAPDGVARLVTRGASAAGGAVELSPQDWRFARGHRIGVLLTGSDDDFYLPAHTGGVVQVDAVTLGLPFLRSARRSLLVQGTMQADHWPFQLPAALIAAREQAMPLPPPMR